MEIWLNTTNTLMIKKASKLGFLHGIMINPLLASKAGKSTEAIYQDILSVQSGPVTANVTAEDSEAMMIQADHFHQISKRIIIKIPVTTEGLNAIHQLARQNVVTMATGISHPNQALLAALAGAKYVALDLIGDRAMEMLESMVKIFGNYKFETKILVASVNDVEEVRHCAELGIDAITVNDNLFNALIGSPQAAFQVAY